MKRTWLVLVATACSSANPSTPDADVSGGSDSGVVVDSATSGAQCPPDQLATHVDGAGQVTCGSIDEPARTTIDARCSAYLGWRDSCNGCPDGPAKWGRVGPRVCANGAGPGNTCTEPTLGAGPAHMFGLDLDGEVNGDDVLYGTLHCIAVPRAPLPSPCRPGWFITARSGSGWSCEPFSETIVGYVRDHCALYLGWQDSCDGCTREPVKWGYAGDGECKNGAGGDNTCTQATLDGEPVKLFGLNMDGDVNGDDKLHVGLRCAAPAPASESTTGACPAGQFVAGTNGDGSAQCTSAAPAIASYIDAHCSIVFGWRDSCGGCSDPPTKWGTARPGGCSTSGGGDDTCTQFTLGQQTVHLYGLSTDGNVNDDDMLFIGLRCQ